MPNPRVGIWWDNGKTILIVAHPPTENTTRTGTRLDSNLSHADEWAAVARKLGRTTDDEYFSVRLVGCCWTWIRRPASSCMDRQRPASGWL